MTAGREERKPGESPDQRAFRAFLGWLDEGSDSGGQRYLEMHGRLVSYFDRKNCRTPRELADETLNRVARRLEEEGAIKDVAPAQYCYIVARFVFLEYQRQHLAYPVSPDDLAALTAVPADETSAQLLLCLEQCLQQLEAEQRALILDYYHGEQQVKIVRRRTLAARFGITLNALSIRACRIRDRLEACIRTCAGNRGRDVFSQSRLI